MKTRRNRDEGEVGALVAPYPHPEPTTKKDRRTTPYVAVDLVGGAAGVELCGDRWGRDKYTTPSLRYGIILYQ